MVRSAKLNDTWVVENPSSFIGLAEACVGSYEWKPFGRAILLLFHISKHYEESTEADYD